MATILNGKQLSEKILKNLEKEVAQLDYIPKLGIIMVGEDPASLAYVEKKKKIGKDIGVEVELYKYDNNISTRKLRKQINIIQRGPQVKGVIVQLPLPEHLSEQKILNAIPKEKDVDCLSERALGGFYTNRWIIGPPAVMALERILSVSDTNLHNKNVVVLGRGKLIGKPITLWLLERVRDLHVLYLDTEEDALNLRDADIIISGVGKPRLIQGEYVKEGAVLIDFGYYYEDGELVGDFAFDECEKSAAVITPTPGGTGPIVVAELFYNFFLLNSGDRA